MSRVHRAGVIAGSRSGAKTYADFEAHIGSISTARGWTDEGTITAMSYNTTAAAAAGVMYGSPFSSVFYRGGTAGTFTATTTCRVVQHGLPSQAVFNAQIAAGYKIMFRVVSAGTSTFSALNRNGYLSLANANTGTAGTCDLLLYWDGTQAQQMNPSAGTGPTPYTW